MKFFKKKSYTQCLFMFPPFINYILKLRFYLTIFEKKKHIYKDIERLWSVIFYVFVCEKIESEDERHE